MNDIIIFGVGHSGTSLLAKMVHTLGWKANDADEIFAESREIRLVNRALVKGNQAEDWEGAAVEVIRSFARPFAVKDPRFVETLDLWAPVFDAAGLKPTLLRIDRNRDELAKSYVDRKELVNGQPGTRGKTLDELLRLADEQYAMWPHPKLRVDYENLVKAALLVKETRSMRRVGGLWLDAAAAPQESSDQPKET